MYRSSIQRVAAEALSVLLAVFAVVSFLASMSHGSPANAAVTRTIVAKVVTPERATILVHTGRIAELMRYTVLPGNTLSGIAQAKCGRADGWPGIYAASRKVVGGNPDLIFPGQVLTVTCAYNPVPPKPVTVVKVAAPRPPKGGTYGHPYFCGDGDGDGWDVKCPSQVIPPPTVHHGVSTSPVKLTSSGGNGSGCTDPSGHLTASQVGMLWVCAGGPAWAEAAAIRVSSCESGWNTFAYNPSGATGLWQILGAVVAGNLYDAHINALNAVSKFKASGGWAQWVCKP